ncbi:hypothetical protein DPMN_117553 [Dreissena polymorpha]|uniref:Uncharacterized protein n=1 Tax=Dreissena polymorpha TaxID=45954 RepID=A0A9D4KQ64_DREPO|nr:hypothetical protein DPMN_117553 [Dreissena polymorpha]
MILNNCCVYQHNANERSRFQDYAFKDRHRENNDFHNELTTVLHNHEMHKKHHWVLLSKRNTWFFIARRKSAPENLLRTTSDAILDKILVTLNTMELMQRFNYLTCVDNAYGNNLLYPAPKPSGKLP